MTDEEITPAEEPQAPVPPPPSPITPITASREPLSLLIIGIILFLSILIFTWAYALHSPARRAGGTFMEAIGARVNTYLVETQLYWGLQPSSPLQRFSRPAEFAAETAELWKQVGKDSDNAEDHASTLVNAAALYGTAKKYASAQASLRRAARIDPAHKGTYLEFLPLYRRPAEPITFSADAKRLLQDIPAGPLIRARNALVAGETDTAIAALRPGAMAGMRYLIFVSVGLLFAGGVFITALIIALTNYRNIINALQAVRRRPASALPWGIGTALILVSLHHLLTFALQAIATAAFRDALLANAALPIILGTVSTIISVVIILGSYLLLLGYHPWDWRVFGWQRTSLGIRYGLATLLVILPLFWTVTLISGLVTGGDRNSTSPVITSLLAERQLWLQLYLVVAAVIMAPLVEETLYRGIIFRALGQELPFWWAALISGAMFSLMHAQLAAVIPFTLLGMVFAFLTRHTRSLWASAAAHGAFNAISSVALLLLTWALRGPGK